MRLDMIITGDQVSRPSNPGYVHRRRDAVDNQRGVFPVRREEEAAKGTGQETTRKRPMAILHTECSQFQGRGDCASWGSPVGWGRNSRGPSRKETSP